MEQKTIITIERQYGSGGERIGELLAQRLNINFFDKEILTEASKESNIEGKVFQFFDEVFVNTGVYSLSPDGNSAGANFGEYKQPPVEQVYLAEFNAIRKLAKEKSGVFIGRCADYVLQEYKNGIHIFVHAPIDVRVKRICQYEKIDRRDAEIIVRKRDKDRERYYNYYTSRKWGNACNYNLTIDTGRIEPDKVAILLTEYVKNINKTV